ncbi:hypothetical protein A9Q81_17455 [Gammaproteobacteria bacterium 42_54_T18]|nr:hypothetical protein A9Q81_17455 [Gammaproteobacteria bacterium 42_54_T18]
MPSHPPFPFIMDKPEFDFVSYFQGNPIYIHQEGSDLLLESASKLSPQIWHWNTSTRTLQEANNVDTAGLFSTLDRTFSCHPEIEKVRLVVNNDLEQTIKFHGLSIPNPSNLLEISSEQFWQSTALWLNLPKTQTYPLRYISNLANNATTSHPLRPDKTYGTLYRRFIPWLKKTFSIRTFDLERDLTHFNNWMNDSRVAFFWEEQGTLQEHTTYIENIIADPHNQPLIGCFDDEPFAYFEAYWAKEDRIAPFCDASDFDRGWHLLVGESAYRGRQWFSAWFPSLQHYLFLDDTRTQRIVAEPRHDNQKLISHASNLGFDKVMVFDFPHKRAQLIRLSRERFFSENRIQPANKT